jgi:histidyl-tRNA synthetase
VREADGVSDDTQAPRAPTGTHDVLPPESWRWQRFIDDFAKRADRFGFGMVHTPIFEDARVFRRGIGAESEVVGKEMYEFEDRGGRQLALRPEGTASIVRAFVQHRPATPWRAWYVTPSFRYERPQAGRYRQHHQVGVEALGSEDPDVDVEVISLAWGFLAGLGLEQITLQLNSMGCGACRPAYVDELRALLAGRVDDLCEEHAARFAANPLRVLDCKKAPCIASTQDAPKIADSLCADCRSHHDRVTSGLEEIEIPFVENPRLVRGFDYYTRTTFEFSSGALEGAQNAVGGGGRYDGLVEMLGGPPTPGIGFGIGIERALLALDAEGVAAPVPPTPAAFVVDLTGGEAARRLVAELRGLGLKVERAYDARSMKSQMKAADRSGAPIALIIGTEEAASGSVTIRMLRQDVEQRTVAVSGLLSDVRTTGVIG